MAITFDSIGNGELAAMFRAALTRIGRNILDPNADPEAARSMTVNIKFKPSGVGTIETAYSVKTKLAGAKEAKTTFLIGQDARTGRVEMSEYGTNRPQVAAYDNLPPAPRAEPVTVQPAAEQDFDPETGEIYEPARPIDLRRQAAVLRMAGNIDRKNNQSYSDDGTSQVATITVGVAAKADALVPNPVELIPFRTFQEVEQPASKFVFRIGDKDVPAFKLTEAEGGIWKNEAIRNIKRYFSEAVSSMPQELQERITIIG